jgi:hypothetical protein
MRNILVCTLTTLSIATAAFAQTDAKATAIIEQARKAIGASKLTASTGLSISGPYRRTMGERDVSGDLAIDLQMPDRFLQTDSMAIMGDAVATRESGVNGDQLLQSSKTSGGGPGMMIRMAGAGGPNADAMMLRAAKADFARYAVALLLAAPAGSNLQFTYGGEASGDNGKADVIDVKDANGFEARLFIDKESHRPLLLSYKAPAPRIVMRTQTSSGSAADAVRDAAQTPPELVEIQVFFEDYRSVDGVMLPHKITRSAGGQPSEEWEIKKAKLNPTFKPETFQKR